MTDHDDQVEDLGPDRAELNGLPVRERDYIVPAADSSHISIRVQCRVQPVIVRLVSDLLARKAYPFRTQGDLLRFCIDRMVRKLARGAGVGEVWALAESNRQFFADEEYQLQFAENFAVMKRVIDWYLERGAPQKARELVVSARARFEQMAEGNYWRTTYLTELDKRYGQLLDGNKALAAPGTGIFATASEDDDGADDVPRH